MSDQSWEFERGHLEMRNALLAVVEHMLGAGATLRDFAVALNTDMSLADVRAMWPPRSALASVVTAAAETSRSAPAGQDFDFNSLSREFWQQQQPEATSVAGSFGRAMPRLIT